MAAVMGTPYLPPGEARAGTVRSFALAAAVHCLLLAFLYFGIRWQSRPPAAVEAELWSEPPRVSAPDPVIAPAAPPEPPTPLVREEPRPEAVPPKPDIAVKEEAKKPEPKKETKPKAEPKTEPKKEDKALPKVIADPFKRDFEKENIKSQLAREARRDEIAQKAASESAALGQKASSEWIQRVSAKIRSKIPGLIADAVAGNPEAVFEVRLLPGLEIGSVRMIKSSGNPAYDEAADRAIKAASPLPPPTSDHVVLPPALTLKMRPKDQ